MLYLQNLPTYLPDITITSLADSGASQLGSLIAHGPGCFLKAACKSLSKRKPFSKAASKGCFWRWFRFKVKALFMAVYSGCSWRCFEGKPCSIMLGTATWRKLVKGKTLCEAGFWGLFQKETLTKAAFKGSLKWFLQVCFHRPLFKGFEHDPLTGCL